MSRFPKTLIPDTLRGRYIFASLALFVILGCAAVIGLITVQNAVQKHHRQNEERVSTGGAVNEFVVQYDDMKHSLLEFLILPDAKHYQHSTESVEMLDEKFKALHEIQQQRNDPAFREYISVMEKDLLNLKSELATITRVRLNPAETFPFTTIMVGMVSTNVTTLSSIDQIISMETEPGDTQFNNLKWLLVDTRYAWVRLMADFRLLVAVRFGIFTGDWQSAFEQRVYNTHLYMEKVSGNLEKLAVMQTSDELPIEVIDTLTILNQNATHGMKDFKRATALLESPAWRKDIKLLADRLQPAFDRLDTTLESLYQKEKGDQLTSMRELSSVAQYLPVTLWLVLFAYSLLVLLSYFIFDKAILKPVHKVATALKNEAEGKTVALESHDSAREITDLTDAFHEMRKQVASRQERLVNILDNAAEAIITIDNNGNIETFNAAAEQLFDYEDEEVLGKSALMLIPEDKHEQYQKLFHEFQHSGQSIFRAGDEDGYEINVLCNHQRLAPVSIKISKTVIDGKTLYTGLVVDISEQIASEAERRRNLAAMAHAGRLNIMGEMAAGIAHELNQPLAAMSMYLRGSLRRYNPDEPETYKEVISAVNSAVEQVDRAGEIIRTMRSFARREAFDRETVDLNDLIRKSVDLVLISEQGESPELKFTPCESPLIVKIDALQVEQVLVNLIRNAFDALSNVEKSQRLIEIKSDVDENGFARVFVIDKGEGVQPENESKIFDTYFTTKKDGLGMGLAICRSIIEDHDGVLWYRPGTEGGAQFCFVLPLHQA